MEVIYCFQSQVYLRQYLETRGQYNRVFRLKLTQQRFDVGYCILPLKTSQPAHIGSMYIHHTYVHTYMPGNNMVRNEIFDIVYFCMYDVVRLFM